MGETLEDIAGTLKNPLRIQLIYAFNATGKTRLSRAFTELITSESPPQDNDSVLSASWCPKILYYNALTEDLFYWENDFSQETGPRLKICPNDFTDWILKDQGQDQKIIENFQSYNNNKLTPLFSPDFREVTFSIQSGDNNSSGPIKISKGEESNFIWSLFYTLIGSIIDVLNTEPENRETDIFNQLDYIFIDDPVSSLDENNLIRSAIELAQLIKDLPKESAPKFIITTHNTLFYNVLHNELFSSKNRFRGYLLTKNESNKFLLEEKNGDSNTSFSYHLYIKSLLEKAVDKGNIQKYHFMLLRNLYERTSNFLGYKDWGDLLPKGTNTQASYTKNIMKYYSRFINSYSHQKVSYDAIAEPKPEEKKMLGFLFKNLTDRFYAPTEKETQAR